MKIIKVRCFLDCPYAKFENEGKLEEEFVACQKKKDGRYPMVCNKREWDTTWEHDDFPPDCPLEPSPY